MGRHGVKRTLEWVSFWGCWNRDKQGSDDDDDDDDNGGTQTVLNVLLCLSGLVRMYLFSKTCHMLNLGVRQRLIRRLLA